MRISASMVAAVTLLLSALVPPGLSTAEATDWRQPRHEPPRRPPPAWGTAPGFQRPPPAWQNEGYPGIRRDRERWRDSPHDRHESRERDAWHEQSRDADRGRRDWRDGEDHRRGGVVRRRDRDDGYRHDDRYRDDGHGGWPPPAYGPYAPVPDYFDRYDPHYRDRDDWRRYDD
ncbi:MAG: hypothetical protein IT493_11690 [Gammaproteobacteria bacterium]|nr:hypothetical protein [Gammaproteobacteria bacterium]